jgi:hypothetical protein
MRRGKVDRKAVVFAVIVLSVHWAPFGGVQASVTRAQKAVADAIAGPQFSDAAFSLERYRTIAGTYDGANVMGRRITMRWATDNAYCIDGVSESGAAEYLLGPRGRLSPGSCPYAAF